MDWTPLIITVTCDPRIQDPRNPRYDELWSVDAIAKEYVDANAAGAVMDHVHGLYSRDPVIQADGKQLQLPDIDGTAGIIEQIRAKYPKQCIQQGLASMRPDQKLQLWERIKPDMSSLNMNSHDEYFDPYPREIQPIACYSVHPINALRQYFQWSKEHGVNPELECFDKPGKKLGEQGIVIVDVGFVRCVEAEEIHDDDAMVLGEWRDDRFPFIEAAPQSVQQNDRRAIASLGVVDVLPVNANIPGHEFGRRCESSCE